MPSVTYSGSFGGVGGYGGLTETLQATSEIKSVPSGAVITGISYSLEISARGYSSSQEWIMQELSIGGGGGSPTAYESTGMTSREHVFSGNMSFSASDVSKFASSTIEVYADAYTTHDTDSFLWDVSITVDYATHTACGAPTACAVNDTLSTENVTLSWSGAKAGTGNAITGFEVQRAESSDGKTWGSWAAVQVVSTTATSGSLSVAPPATVGNYYKYRVRTRGAAGSSYYSGWKESTNTLRKDHAALAGFTDATLTAEATPVKALHMQELQDRISTLRAFYGLSAYGFTNIVAGQTSLAGWSAHVLEIRTAIDEIAAQKGVTHAAWLAITENKPRVDVLQQLREVVLSL